MIRKYHNHKLQTTPWHREEEPFNHHETPGRQIKQSNQLSLPHQDDCNTKMEASSPTVTALARYPYKTGITCTFLLILQQILANKTLLVYLASIHGENNYYREYSYFLFISHFLSWVQLFPGNLATLSWIQLLLIHLAPFITRTGIACSSRTYELQVHLLLVYLAPFIKSTAFVYSSCTF